MLQPLSTVQTHSTFLTCLLRVQWSRGHTTGFAFFHMSKTAPASLPKGSSLGDDVARTQVFLSLQIHVEMSLPVSVLKDRPFKW